MLISLHLPKTAGSSFATLLSDHFEDGMVTDYADKPLHQSALSRRLSAWRGPVSGLPGPETRCVHGHFLPYKYRRLKGSAAFVTWFREPVDRLRSHYDFWRREYNPDTAGRIHQRMMAQDWSFERFALGPELRNVYARFLWRFPLEDFDFIGLFEALETDTDRFARQYFDEPVALPEQNRRPGQPDDLAPDLVNRIRAWHACDVALYDRAKALRDLQVSTHSAV